MTDLIGDLKSRRLVKEMDPVRRPGAGRPTRPIALDGVPWCALGIHLTHDAVEISATSMGGEELWLTVDPVKLHNADPEAAFGQVRDVIHRRLPEVPDTCEVISVEVAVAGAVVRGTGQVANSAELPWTNFPLRDRVRAALAEAGLVGIHVGIAGNCQLAGLYAARAEAQLPPDSVAVYVGGYRNVGSGLIVDGQIFGGAHGAAGDLSHAHVGGDQVDPICGRTGCLTSAVGPDALLIRSGLMSADESAQHVLDDSAGALNRLRAEAEAGNDRVLTTLADAGAALGRVLDDAIGLLDPHAAIIGGYLGVLAPYLREDLDAQLSRRLADQGDAATAIVVLESLEPRVARGAAMAARDAVLANPIALTRPILIED